MKCVYCGYESETIWFDACPECGKGGIPDIKMLPDKIEVPTSLIIAGLCFVSGLMEGRRFRRKRKKRGLR